MERIMFMLGCLKVVVCCWFTLPEYIYDSIDIIMKTTLFLICIIFKYIFCDSKNVLIKWETGLKEQFLK